MNRAIVVALLAVAALVLLRRLSVSFFGDSPLDPDDGPSILWVDDHMGEPWAVLWQRERVA